jgi:hypothetical protein
MVNNGLLRRLGLCALPQHCAQLYCLGLAVSFTTQVGGQSVLQADHVRGTARLPATIAAYKLMSTSSREANVLTGRYLSSRTGIEAVVSVQSAERGRRANDVASLERATIAYARAIASAQTSGQLDRYRVAFSTADSVVTANGKAYPGRRVAVVARKGATVSIHIFHAFLAGDKLLSVVTSLPVAQLAGSDIEYFAHAIVRQYTSPDWY